MDAVAVPHRLSVSATALGPAGSRWLGDLPGVLAGLATDWSITYGRPFDGGNAAYVIEAVTADARPVILKVALPPGVDGVSPFEQELEALRLAGGDPYADLIRHDLPRRSMLLERLGPSLASLGWPRVGRLTTAASTLARGWRPAPAGRLPTGAEKAEWLADYVARQWAELGRPCSSAAMETAIGYAAERASERGPPDRSGRCGDLAVGVHRTCFHRLVPGPPWSPPGG